MKTRGATRYLLTLISCCLLAASSVGVYMNSVGVFYTTVAADLGVGRGAFALHATLCSLTVGFLSPLAVGLLKKRSFRVLLAAGSLLSAAATALMALARGVAAFYALGIIRGVGMTMFSLMPVTTLINNWFQKKHGLAVGVTLSFSGIAGAVFSPLFSGLIASAGWRGAFLWMAGIGFILTVPGMLVLSLQPEELGMTPYGGEARPAGPGQAAERTPSGAGIYLPAMALLCLMTLLHTSVTGIAQHFPGMAEWMGLGATVGAAMVSAGMVGNIVSKLAIGTLSDRFGPFRACACMIVVNSLALLGLFLVGGSHSWAALGLAFFYGSVYSVGAVGIPVLTRRLFGPANYARAYSVVTVFTCVGSASALTIIGLIYDRTGGYGAALAGGLIIDLVDLAILCALAARHRGRASA